MDIRHDAEGGRFFLEREGDVAVLDYHIPSPGALHLTRTWVPPRFRGRGYGARLVKAALEHARSEGYRITTSCWFVDEFLDRNPAYQDLLAD